MEGIPITQWLLLGAGLLIHAVVLTAFFYREFATKRDLSNLETHLREIATKDYKLLLEKLAQLHDDIKDLQKIIKDRLIWKD